MLDHSYFANLTWEIADPLRGTYRSPQYERVIVPKIVLAFIPSTLPKEWPELKAAGELNPEIVGPYADRFSSIQVKFRTGDTP
jgi:hypothetical protein